MNTQKIKVMIEAEVPVGDNCIHCDYKRSNWCYLFQEKVNICGGAPYKIQQCLDAFENGKEKKEAGNDK